MVAGEKGLRGRDRGCTYRSMASLPSDARIGRVRLRVGDLGRALAFYQGVLGLGVSRDEGQTVTLTASRGSDAGSTAPPRELLVLEERPGIAHRPARPVTTGLYHVALLVPDRRALGRALLHLNQTGYPLRGMSDHAVSESLYLDDPTGMGSRSTPIAPDRYGRSEMV